MVPLLRFPGINHHRTIIKLMIARSAKRGGCFEMLVDLKLTLIRRQIRQTRMAIDLGWDPAKLSRIVNESLVPSAADRAAISCYLKLSEAELFRTGAKTTVIGSRQLRKKQ